MSGKTASAMYYVASQLGGTICYVAPEVLKGEDLHITTSADMWSLGAVLTFVANDRQHLFKREWDVFNWKGDRSPIRRKLEYPQLHQLVLSLLSVDKHKRPTARQVYKNHCSQEKQSSPPNSPRLKHPPPPPPQRRPGRSPGAIRGAPAPPRSRSLPEDRPRRPLALPNRSSPVRGRKCSEPQRLLGWTPPAIRRALPLPLASNIPRSRFFL